MSSVESFKELNNGHLSEFYQFLHKQEKEPEAIFSQVQVRMDRSSRNVVKIIGEIEQSMVVQGAGFCECKCN